MAAKKKKAATRGKSRGTASSRKSKKREPPAKKMIIRRNAAPARARPAPVAEEPERTALSERIESMDGSHVAAGVGIGALANVLGVITVGRGWIGPKTTAGLLMGAGALTTAAGYYWERDHMMAAGVGVATAGAFSIANQVAIDAYEAMEKRADEKRAKQEAEKEAKRLAEARALLERHNQTRNARRLVVLDQDGEVIHVPAYDA